VIDPARCMAPRDDEPLGVARCQEPATHDSIMGRRCVRHAEMLRRSLRNPRTLANLVLGAPRTEAQIARLVVELPS
jgi:hypothetical protein